MSAVTQTQTLTVGSRMSVKGEKAYLIPMRGISCPREIWTEIRQSAAQRMLRWSIHLSIRRSLQRHRGLGSRLVNAARVQRTFYRPRRRRGSMRQVFHPVLYVGSQPRASTGLFVIDCRCDD